VRSTPLVSKVRIRVQEPDDRRDVDAATGAELHAYLRRIGLPVERAEDPVGEDLLRAVVAAQIATVPFENLDIHRGIPVDLDVAALTAKLVTGRRGGICYELNGLLARVLRGLGFDARLVGATVLAEGVPGPPLGHVAVVVRADGQVWLVDAGFGGEALVEEITDGDPGAGTPIEVRFDSGAAYRTDGTVRPLSDFVAMAHWHSTSPRSRFTGGIVCSVTGPDSRRTLSCAPDGGYRLVVTAGGSRTVHDLDSVQVVEVLHRDFGITLADPPRPRTFGSQA